MEAVSVQTWYLNPPRKFKNIEKQLQSLHGRPTLLRYLDNAQDNEDIGGLLEDLQEVVNNYMVCS